MLVTSAIGDEELAKQNALLAALASFSSTNNSGPVVYAANAGSGDGMDVSTSSGVGMLAQSNTFDGAATFANSTGGWGIFSEANGDANFETGVAGFEYGSTQENVGVWGYAASPHGVGVYDEGYTSSTEGTICCAGLYSIGMWADTSGTSSSNAGIAALTTVDTGYSIVSYSNSSYPTVWLENDVSTDSTAPVLITNGGSTGGVCIVDVGGNLTCSGSITPAVPVNNGAKKVALYGMEAAENWFEDAGAGQLTNGSAIIRLDQTFAETVNTNMDYHVFLTPNGDCKGLYVSRKSPTSFEVHELGGGTSSIAFDYRIMAKRRGYEAARLEDRTAQFGGHAPAKRANGNRSVNPDAVRNAHAKKDEEARKALAMVKPVVLKAAKK